MRIPAVLLALAVAAVTFLLPAGAAHAYTPLKASITCDTATDTISTRLSGNSGRSNFAYKMKFQVWQGSYVNTAGTKGSNPAYGTSLHLSRS